MPFVILSVIIENKSQDNDLTFEDTETNEIETHVQNESEHDMQLDEYANNVEEKQQHLFYTTDGMIYIFKCILHLYL